MDLDRRVTLRCLTDDLVSDWADTDQRRAVLSLRTIVNANLTGAAKESEVARHARNIPRLNALLHPLLRHFDRSFRPDYDASKLESISGLSDPHWWKQKTQQWRGAATDHSRVPSDTVWLCSAGLRRDKDEADFYHRFKKRVESAGPELFLPTEEDTQLVKIDKKISAFDAWKLQVHCATLALLSEALSKPKETFEFRIPKPSTTINEEYIGTVSLSVETIHEGDAALHEAIVVATVIERAHIKSLDIACQIARAALQSDAEEWKATPYVGESYAFAAIIDKASVRQATELSDGNELSGDLVPGELRLGLRAHYTRKDGILSAQLDGSALQSLCGYWFVPIKDHVGLDECQKCRSKQGVCKVSEQYLNQSWLTPLPVGSAAYA